LEAKAGFRRFASGFVREKWAEEEVQAETRLGHSDNGFDLRILADRRRRDSRRLDEVLDFDWLLAPRPRGRSTTLFWWVGFKFSSVWMSRQVRFGYISSLSIFRCHIGQGECHERAHWYRNQRVNFEIRCLFR
jgi:hypothetical protein